jgi:bacterial/archaeal transporter family protein
MMTQTDVGTVLLLVVTMVLWGSAPLVEKLGLQGIDPLTGVLIRSLSVSFVLSIVFVVTGKMSHLAQVPVKSAGFFATAGILGGLLGTWTYYCVLKTGAMSQVVPIAAAFPLVTSIIAFVFLKESVTPLRMAGTILIIAGILLVKRG